MIHKIHRAIIFSGMVMIFCLIFGMNIFAKTEYKVLNATPNIWMELLGEGSSYDDTINDWVYTDFVYKLVLPSDGYINLETKEDSVSILKKLDKEGNEKRISVSSNSNEKIALEKGTYYLRGGWLKGQCKYSFVPVKATTNYCIKKAASLKAGKTVAVCMSKKHLYSRWYKIKLKKKKRITIWTNDEDRFIIYDSKFNILGTEQAGTKSSQYFTKKQKKGTYYIRIIPRYSEYFGNKNKVVTLKWG